MKTMSITAKQVAKRLKAQRETLGVPQGAVADAAGIDRKTVNRIENCHFSPSLDTFFRICIALDVEPEKVISD